MHLHEHNPEPSNPLGMDGIEFVEFATSQPQALGGLLQRMGFAAIARHRSREVMLYRQGPMNLIVNAHPEALPGMAAPSSTPSLAAIAFRVAPRARPRRMGDADARLGDGAQHPGNPRRRRLPSLFRRQIP